VLILTRKAGEVIAIGDDITVTVLGISGRHVRLGVEAPKKIEVHREEIYRKIQEGKSSSKKPSLAKLKEFARKVVGKPVPKPHRK